MKVALLSTCLALCAAGDDAYQAWTSESLDEASLPESAGTPLTDQRWEAICAEHGPPPYREMTVGYELGDGTCWVGTPRGVVVHQPEADAWRLFHSKRWLPDDRVEKLAVVSPDEVWIHTAAGSARLARKPATLTAKMQRIHALLRKHHIRSGLVGEIVVNEPGNIESGHFQPDNDNDGLWTSLYVAAEAFRYASTGDEGARRNARQSLEALMYLEEITEIPGFAARSIVPIEIDKSNGPGEWHRSSDGEWWWKGDTSSDELDGHYFAYGVYYDLVADEEEKQTIAALVARMTDHILDHGYYYVGPPGKPTTWGVWAPEKLNHDLTWILDRGLNSLEMLSHLKVAAHMTGNPRYEQAIAELNAEHSYHLNTVRQKILWPLEEVNHSDDELAFLAYYPLLWYERDPALREIYLASIERSWQIERAEVSPLFNYIYAAALQADHWTDPAARPVEAFVEAARFDGDQCRTWFQQVPEDMFLWRVENRHRADLGELVVNRFGQARTRHVLPVDERRLMRWNGDPYELDGGRDGRVRDDGAYVLLPYWMGRYHRFLD